MAIVKLEFNCKQALKLAMVGAGAFLFLTPSVKAVELISIPGRDSERTAPATTDRVPHSPSRGVFDSNGNRYKPSNPSILAAVQICQSKRRWATAETKNYRVYICGKATPGTYIGVAKNGSGDITLPISSYSENVYTASQNGYTYTLDMNKRQLIIKLPNGKRSIEKVISTAE